MSVLESATEAANRIIHGNTNPDDIRLVAGVLLQILGAVAPLIEACENAFDADDRAWPDDVDVMTPPTGITFGMIRRARGALDRAAR